MRAAILTKFTLYLIYPGEEGTSGVPEPKLTTVREMGCLAVFKMILMPVSTAASWLLLVLVLAKVLPLLETLIGIAVFFAVPQTIRTTLILNLRISPAFQFA